MSRFKLYKKTEPGSVRDFDAVKDPNVWEKGRGVYCDGTTVGLVQAVNRLHDLARHVLDRGTIYELRESLVRDIDGGYEIAFYANATMQSRKSMGATYIIFPGYTLLGRFKTPE